MNECSKGNAPIVTIALSLPNGEVAADRLTVGVNHELNMHKRHNGNPPIAANTLSLPKGEVAADRLTVGVNHE